IAAMLEVDVATARQKLAELTRECLVTEARGYRTAHPVIAETALAALGDTEVARMRGRLGAHLLATSGGVPGGAAALRIAMLLDHGAIELTGADRVRAAELHVTAAEHVMASAAYEIAATLFTGAAVWLGGIDGDPWERHHELQFRIELGLARALM